MKKSIFEILYYHTPLSYIKETTTLANVGNLLQRYKNRHQKQETLILTVA